MQIGSANHRTNEWLSHFQSLARWLHISWSWWCYKVGRHGNGLPNFERIQCTPTIAFLGAAMPMQTSISSGHWGIVLFLSHAQSQHFQIRRKCHFPDWMSIYCYLAFLDDIKTISASSAKIIYKISLSVCNVHVHGVLVKQYTTEPVQLLSYFWSRRLLIVQISIFFFFFAPDACTTDRFQFIRFA